MKTLNAENETAFERLRNDMAHRDIEAAKRDKNLLMAITGLFVAATTIIIGAIAIL